MPPGETLALVGGDVRFEGGRIQAPGADVRLGGLAEAGVVGLDGNAGVSFPEDIARTNLALSESTEVNTIGDGGGSIALTVRNLSLRERSLILTGIASGSTGGNTAGDITVDATEAVTLDEGSIIASLPSGIGNSGEIELFSNSLELANSSTIISAISGNGNAGNIRIQVFDSITLQTSSISSLVGSGAVGNSGDIIIETSRLSLLDGSSQISAGVNTNGEGNGGDIQIRATDSILLQGGSETNLISFISSNLGNEAIGNAGEYHDRDKLAFP